MICKLHCDKSLFILNNNEKKKKKKKKDEDNTIGPE